MMEGTSKNAGQILNVDDSAGIRRYRSTVLRDAGFVVREAADGREALSLIDSFHPDLVLLDVRMPGLDGFEVCRQIKATPWTRHIAVLYITGECTDPSDWTRGLDAGADTYLLEPIDPTVLVAVARALLRRSASEAAARAAEMEACKRLEEREQSQRELFEKDADILYSFDKSGCITAVNHMAEEISGLSRTDMIGRHLRALVAPEHAESLAERFQLAMNGHLCGPHEVEILANGGGRIPVEIRTYPIMRGGQLVEVRGAARDIRDRKTLEIQLGRAQRMEAIGRLAGGIAHDFNNLLTIIHGCTSLAMEQLPPDHPARRDLLDVQAAGERAAALSRQLLTFGRKQALPSQYIDIDRFIKDTVTMLERLIGEHILIRLDLKCDGTPVLADPSQVEQLIVNLALNARDAMPGGGELSISSAIATTPADGSNATEMIALTVADTGHGIDAETLTHIFEPFFTTKPNGRGTGMGLATVYGIVMQANGSIDVVSEPGRGTTFTIHLPIASTRQQPGDAAADTPATNASGHHVVLIVEEDARVRRMARTYLEQSGYVVLEAAGRHAATVVLETHVGDVHVLLTDAGLPEATGANVLDALRERQPHLKVLFMSGYGHANANETFLPKPFTKESLIAGIEHVLDTAQPPSSDVAVPTLAPHKA